MTALLLIAGVIAAGIVFVVWCCLRIGAQAGPSWDELAESVSEANAQRRDAANQHHKPTHREESGFWNGEWN